MRLTLSPALLVHPLFHSALPFPLSHAPHPADKWRPVRIAAAPHHSSHVPHEVRGLDHPARWRHATSAIATRGDVTTPLRRGPRWTLYAWPSGTASTVGGTSHRHCRPCRPCQDSRLLSSRS